MIKYMSLKHAVDALRTRLSRVSKREIACWMWLQDENNPRLEAFLHVNQFDNPPRLELDLLAASDWTKSTREYPPYLSVLEGAFFDEAQINAFQPAERFLSYSEIVERWIPFFAGNRDEVAAFIRSSVSQSRLLEFAPGLGPTEISGDPFNGTITLPHAEWAMFKLAEVEAVEAADLADLDQSAEAKQQNRSVVSNPKKQARDKQRRQEKAIVEAVKRLGYDPKAIPKCKNGHSGVRSEVRHTLTIPSELFGTARTYKLAWERTRLLGDIKDAEDHPPSIK